MRGWGVCLEWCFNLEVRLLDLPRVFDLGAHVGNGHTISGDQEY